MIHKNMIIKIFLYIGIVLDSGDTLTQIVPVYEGYGIKHATEVIQIGGRDVTERLRHLIGQRGHAMPTTAGFEILKEMKEKSCFVKTREELENQSDIKMRSTVQYQVGFPEPR